MSRSQRVVRLDDYRKPDTKPRLPVVRTQDKKGVTVRYWLIGAFIAIAIGFGASFLISYYGSSVVAHWVS